MAAPTKGMQAEITPSFWAAGKARIEPSPLAPRLHLEKLPGGLLFVAKQ